MQRKIFGGGSGGGAPSGSAGGDLAGSYPNPTVKPALTPTTVKTGAYTAAPGDLVLVDTTGGAVTITAPAATAGGKPWAVKHVIQGGTNAVTIACAGSDVFNKAGGSTTATLPLVNQSMRFTQGAGVHYVDAADSPLGALDLRYLLASGIKTIRKTADETVNNSAALQNDDHLVLPVLASEVWAFDLTLLLTSGNTIPDWQFAWTVPAGATMQWGGVSSSGTANQWVTAGVAASPISLTSESGVILSGSAASGVSGVFFRGVIVVSSTAGNVQFQWAQNTAHASDSKVLANSHMVARKLA